MLAVTGHHRIQVRTKRSQSSTDAAIAQQHRKSNQLCAQDPPIRRSMRSFALVDDEWKLTPWRRVKVNPFLND